MLSMDELLLKIAISAEICIKCVIFIEKIAYRIATGIEKLKFQDFPGLF